MRIKINTKKIEALNPCENRLDNWLSYYSEFKGDIVKFLDLPNITHHDKIWVAMRVMPRFLVEVFALDCAFHATDATDAMDAAANAAAHAAAAYAAAYAANAAYAVDERQRQIESLIYLIKKH